MSDEQKQNRRERDLPQKEEKNPFLWKQVLSEMLAVKQQKIFKSDRTGFFGTFPGRSNLEDIDRQWNSLIGWF